MCLNQEPAWARGHCFDCVEQDIDQDLCDLLAVNPSGRKILTEGGLYVDRLRLSLDLGVVEARGHDSVDIFLSENGIHVLRGVQDVQDQSLNTNNVPIDGPHEALHKFRIIFAFAHQL